MKKVYSLAILFYFFCTTLNSVAQKNDSINKKDHKFLLGVTIAPNLSWRKDGNSYSNNNLSSTRPSAIIKEQPELAYSFMFNTKITLKRFMFNVGFGEGFYNFKGQIHDETSWGLSNYRKEDWNYEYKYTLFGINTSSNILLEKNKLWYAGLSYDINYITKLTQDVNYVLSQSYNATILNSEENWDYNFTKKMLAVWIGLEAGRTIKPVKWVQINVAANCKYSSKIVANEVLISYSPKTYASASPSNLITTSLSISIYPIFKQK